MAATVDAVGSKKPLLIMGHSDTVKVDPAKWTFPPFGGTRNGGYVYGRGTLDDKTNLYAAMMTMVMLKRTKAKLARDVIFVSEAGEEGNSSIGIGYLVSEHFSEIEAEACLAEGGGVVRRAGTARYAMIQTMEKRPSGARLVAKGPSGHGSRPMRGNAIRTPLWCCGKAYELSAFTSKLYLLPSPSVTVTVHHLPTLVS